MFTSKSKDKTSYTRRNPRFKRSPEPYMTPEKLEYHAQLLSNRLRNRFPHLSKKFRRQNIDCFRLYDWDIKEVRAVIDWYKGHVVIAEYERTQTGPAWLPRMARAVAETLNIPMDKVHMRRRHTKKEGEQRYTKMGSSGNRFEVNERDLKFLVNLSDYLDTGLFSDHRETRMIIRRMARDKDFLNLYAYTGAFTCAAAAGGARSIVTVDRSQTYIEWAEDNLKLNGLQSPDYQFVRSDTSFYLARAQREGKKFNLCMVDPPSFSGDKLRDTGFDINRDHPQLLRDVLQVMARGGTVFFSTNHQRFEPQLGGLKVKDLKEITLKTIPEDYRNKQIHRLWQMTAL